MLEPNATGQTAQVPATNGTGEQTGDDAMTTQAFLEDMIAQRGAPETEEGADPQMAALIQNQFRQDTRAYIEDIKEAIREVSPDVSRGDLQKYTRAVVQGDPMEAWKIAQSATRKEMEAEQNSSKTEDLRVEGSNSGTKGTDAPPTTPFETVAAISSLYE